MRIEPGERDHYRVLGVPRDASMPEIRRAYRRLARQHHPDISLQPRDGAYFTALTTAYEVLRDPGKRARYDDHRAEQFPCPRDDRARHERQTHHWVDSSSAAGQAGPVRGRDRRGVLELAEREAALLAIRSITVQADGYTVRLPVGIRAGQLIRVIGAGERGWRGGPPGDLLLTLAMPLERPAIAGARLIDLLFAPLSASNTSIVSPEGKVHMALIRWEPVAELAAVQNEMNRLFNTLFDQPLRGDGLTRRWVPAMDLVETDDHYVLRADLPGLSQQDVNIELEADVLTISGERKAEHEQQAEGYYRVERAFGSFARSLTLPEGIDPDAVHASFDRGVLEIPIPKPEQRKPRKVAITTGSADRKTITEAATATGNGANADEPVTMGS